METIYNQFKAGMDNIYNSFFISFLALKPLMERPMNDNFIIPIEGLQTIYWKLIKLIYWETIPLMNM